MPRVGTDEKAFKKGHSYITLLYDLDNSTVELSCEENDAEVAKACFARISKKQFEAIAMDMSAACVKATKEMLL